MSLSEEIQMIAPSHLNFVLSILTNDLTQRSTDCLASSYHFHFQTLHLKYILKLHARTMQQSSDIQLPSPISKEHYSYDSSSFQRTP
mmetsp:Transcript_20961/g.32370  ORF Transcript_20961/g.32370 Transcript_20961/m.32370 type:complete len:87 (+) Transcript_20961:36-296(+)